ncbi:MAG: hypothetical protein D3924_19935, partial [Candidatus Electrothrix sp. AR4]|nr:hypothetical protein [Candidatus Electrothrix sp. AR4]
GQQSRTGCIDAEQLSTGVFSAYTEENLRYSQNAALSMYEEVNTKNNLPAQIDIYAVPGESYRFLFIAKGGDLCIAEHGQGHGPVIIRGFRIIQDGGDLPVMLWTEKKRDIVQGCPGQFLQGLRGDLEHVCIGKAACAYVLL